MFHLKRFLWLIVATLIGTAILGMLNPFPVGAQDTTPPADAQPSDKGCVSCHENLYYLHDTGKWYCQCAVEMSCTCCHGGNPEAFTEEEGHAGMVALPINNDATTCQGCHPDDFTERVEKFAAVAGVSTFHPAMPTTTWAAPIVEPPAVSQPGSLLAARLLEPWRLAGLGLVAIALVVLSALGYRCWKADCLARSR